MYDGVGRFKRPTPVHSRLDLTEVIPAGIEKCPNPTLYFVSDPSKNDHPLVLGAGCFSRIFEAPVDTCSGVRVDRAVAVCPVAHRNDDVHGRIRKGIGPL